jgi:hypothetical protein
MDSSNLFSHPDAPEYVALGQASRKPVECPTFSDRPGAATDVGQADQRTADNATAVDILRQSRR